MNVREVVREAFVWIARLVVWPFSFLLRIFARLLLIACTAAPVALPVLALIGLFLLLRDPEATVLGLDLAKYVNGAFARTVAFLIGAGVLAGLLKTMGGFAWREFLELEKAVSDVLHEKGWLAGLAIKNAFAITWNCNFARIPSETRKTLQSARRLTYALIAGVLLVVVAYPFFDPPVRLVDRYVAVVDVRDTKPETTSHTIKLFMRTSAVFSLAHTRDAQPQEGEGICLEQPQRDWLDEFRKAIANCMAEGSTNESPQPPEFVVTGYASIAPMHVGGDASQSARLNCKVANWRAAAVGAYLANGANAEDKAEKTRWGCEEVKATFNDDAPNDTHPCGKHYDGPKNQEDNPFRVKVNQWDTPAEMVTGKPADDGTPNDRRFDVEILNRVVHIGVPTKFCRDAGSQ